MILGQVIQCHTLRFHIHKGCVLVWCFTLELSTHYRNQPTAEGYSIKQYLKPQLHFSRFFQASWHKVFSFTTILASKILRKIRFIWIANQEPLIDYILFTMFSECVFPESKRKTSGSQSSDVMAIIQLSVAFHLL